MNGVWTWNPLYWGNTQTHPFPLAPSVTHTQLEHTGARKRDEPSFRRRTWNIAWQNPCGVMMSIDFPPYSKSNAAQLRPSFTKGFDWYIRKHVVGINQPKNNGTFQQWTFSDKSGIAFKFRVLYSNTFTILHLPHGHGLLPSKELAMIERLPRQVRNGKHHRHDACQYL